MKVLLLNKDGSLEVDQAAGDHGHWRIERPVIESDLVAMTLADPDASVEWRRRHYRLIAQTTYYLIYDEE